MQLPKTISRFALLRASNTEPVSLAPLRFDGGQCVNAAGSLMLPRVLCATRLNTPWRGCNGSCTDTCWRGTSARSDVDCKESVMFAAGPRRNGVGPCRKLATDVRASESRSMCCLPTQWIRERMTSWLLGQGPTGRWFVLGDMHNGTHGRRLCGCDRDDNPAGVMGRPVVVIPQ